MTRAKMMLAAALALAACGCEPQNPYRSDSSNPPGQNPQGTPADRTGGASWKPDDAGEKTMKERQAKEQQAHHEQQPPQK